MRQYRMRFKKGLLIAMVFSTLVTAMPAKADQLLFTAEEQGYIENREPIEAASVHGAAPLQYADSEGRIKGISKEVLDVISELTGLSFTYRLYETVEEVFNSGADIFFGIPPAYALDNMVMSVPYLVSETILYINSTVDPNELADKKYAAVKGVRLLEGINEENVIYYETREACLDAVNKGKADYGYGNSYSVAYYTLQNSYRNIIAIPEKKELREYSVGFLEDDEILLSIINKSITSISETRMRTIILNAATQIEMKITVPMVIEAYGLQIFGVIFAVMIVLLLSFLRNVKAKNEIKIQYERYQMLSQTSNEYLYEYHVKTGRLELSKNCIDLFGSDRNLNELINAFDLVLKNKQSTIPVIELPIADGQKRYFKSVNSFLNDDKGRVHSIIGKLIDVSKEEAEKKELIKRSEVDGLTGIYNSVTTKKLITEILKSADPGQNDALIVIDGDKFKSINDTHGHLRGDKVLVNISRGMTRVFRKTDILGRVGGDEFCVYVRGIPSPGFVVSKCQELMDVVRELNKAQHVTVSIGIALPEGERSYDELFGKADRALYEAKKQGGDRVQLFGQLTQPDR